MEINGTYISGGHTPQPQRVFVTQTSLDRVHAVAAMYDLPAQRVTTMLHDACDLDNYRRDTWSKTIDNVRFDFHAARFEIELRSFGRHE